ncbi:MAG TPA: ATP-binding protein [Natronosporangium sp.]
MADDLDLPSVGERLRAVRRDRFVGRTAELAWFAELLAARQPEFRLVWVHGPGGVGKSALCGQFQELARAAGRPVTYVDAREVELTRAGLAAALGEPVPGRVTVLDTFERCAPLADWLRESLLPGWPADGVLVVAGRHPPDARWLADPGWRDLLRPMPLRNLRPEESRDFLASRGVVGPAQASAIGFTHGHPLALALVAEMLAGGEELAPVRADQEPELVRILLERFVDRLPTGRRREALAVCAHVRVTTEAVLAEVLGGDDAAELFEWLRGRSFVEQGPHGLFPHDLARDLLDADLRWRNPAGYRSLHAATRAAAVRRVQATAGVWQDRAMLDFLFLHRNSAVMGRYADWESFGSVQPVAATDADLPELLAMIERYEGRQSASIARRWYARQPDGFSVFRDPAGDIVGMQATVSLHDAAPADLDADPATKAAMGYARRYAPPRPGDELVYHRFSISRDRYQAVSPATNLFYVTANRHWLTRPRLAWAFIAVSDPDFWQPLMSYLDFWRAAEADFEVGRRYGVFAHDWRAQPLPVWFELMEERELLTAESEIPTRPAPAAPPLVVLSEPEFVAAVRRALRDYSRPRALAASPLLRSRVTMAPGNPRPGPDDLRRVLREAAETLRGNPRDEKLYRAVHRTYLEPAATQELAAERLGLPFSTYRRHLTAGVDRIAEWLWQRELSGPD